MDRKYEQLINLRVPERPSGVQPDQFRWIFQSLPEEVEGARFGLPHLFCRNQQATVIVCLAEEGKPPGRIFNARSFQAKAGAKGHVLNFRLDLCCPGIQL